MPITLPSRPGGYVGKRVIIQGPEGSYLIGKTGTVLREGITVLYIPYPPDFGATLLVAIEGVKDDVWLRPSQLAIIEE